MPNLLKTALDPIIRQVDRRDSPIDKNTQKVVAILLNPKRSLLEFKKEVFLLVSNYRGGDCGASFIASIEDFASNWRLQLLVDYRVRCAEGSFLAFADRIAEKLYDAAGPQQQLESTIRQWIEHYVSQVGGPATFLQNFYQQREPLAKEIRRWAQDQLCLDLRPTISLKTDSDVKETIEIPAFSSKIIFQDYERALNLQVGPIALDIHSNETKAILAHIMQRDAPRLRDVIDKALREHIKSCFKLHQFRKESLQTDVRPKLKEHLNTVLANYGRVVRALDLRCDSPVFDAPSPYKSLMFKFTSTVPDLKKEVNIEAYLQMRLVDLGLFATVNVESPPDEWARRALQSLVTQHLSRFSYVKLMDRWDEEKLAIDQELKSLAAAIGYEWTYTYIGTDLPFDLREPIEIPIENLELTTKNSESKVILSGKIVVRIDNMAELAKRNPRELDLRKRVRECVYTTLNHFAKDYSPKQWALKFDSDPGGRALKETLADELSNNLRRELGGTLMLLDIERDGKLLKHLKDLRETAPFLSFKVTRAEFPTELSFRTLDVFEDKWHRFEATLPTIDKVTERIILHTQQMFADDDPVQFRKLRNDEIMQRLNGSPDRVGLQAWIKEQYGLEIYIDHWIRQRTNIEKDADDTRTVAEEAVIETQRQFLESQKDAAQDLAVKTAQKQEIRRKILRLDPDLDIEEIKRLEQRLRDIDKDLKDSAPEMLKGILAVQSGIADESLKQSLAPPNRLALEAAVGQGSDKP